MSSEQQVSQTRRESTKYASKYADMPALPKFSHIRVPPAMTSDEVLYMLQQQDEKYDPTQDQQPSMDSRLSKARRRFSVVADKRMGMDTNIVKPMVSQQSGPQSRLQSASDEPRYVAVTAVDATVSDAGSNTPTDTVGTLRPAPAKTKVAVTTVVKPSIEVSNILVATSKRQNHTMNLDASEKSELKALLTPVCFTCGRNLQQPMREASSIASNKTGCSTCMSVSYAEKTQKHVKKDSRIEKELISSAVGPGKYSINHYDIDTVLQRRNQRSKEVPGGFDSHTGSADQARMRSTEKYKKDRRQLQHFLQDVVSKRHQTQRKAEATLERFDAKFSPPPTRQGEPIAPTRTILRGNWEHSRMHRTVLDGDAVKDSATQRSRVAARDNDSRLQNNDQRFQNKVAKGNINSVHRTRGFLISLQNAYKK